MQEETTQKTIALAIKTSKLTASVLQKAMKMYLEHQKHKEPSHGKIPVKKLVGQGEGAKSIEVMLRTRKAIAVETIPEHLSPTIRSMRRNTPALTRALRTATRGSSIRLRREFSALRGGARRSTRPAPPTPPAGSTSTTSKFK